MILFIYIWICNVLSAKSFFLQDTYNILLKDSADYKIDLIITEDDYEMINKDQLKDFKIDADKEKFNDLNEMARVEYNKRSLNIKPNTNLQYNTTPSVLVVTGKRNNILTALLKPIARHAIHKRGTTKENETEYDYDDLVNEYYEEANNESRSNDAYHIRKSVSDLSEYGPIDSLKRIFLLGSDTENCTEIKGIGLIAVKCLIDDYNNQRLTNKDIAAWLWRVFQIWFLVYLAVAIPLWCTRGWCCCCLRCKFFKPRQTIEEAKKYVVFYPPGVFKRKNGVIHYEPSEREMECYEEFEHFIKTL